MTGTNPNEILALLSLLTWQYLVYKAIMAACITTQE